MKWCIVEKEFYYKGYKCVVIFNKMGFRCGYVGVQPEHPWWGKNYDEYGPEEIQCHWGLTYSGHGENFSNDNLWYFGFDCGHYGDGTEISKAKEYGLVDNDRTYIIIKTFEDQMNACDDVTIKDVAFVEEICKVITEQLSRVENYEG